MQKKRVLKKSEVMQEGYEKGLKEAKAVLERILSEAGEPGHEPKDIVRYRVQDILRDAKSILDKVDGGEHSANIERDWFDLKESVKELGAALNKVYGRGTFKA